MNIAIIGAGPVGSYTASLLSQAGFKVALFDQKKPSQIGYPIQCTGLFSSEIKKFVPLHSSFLVNTTSCIELFSPEQNKIKLNKTEYVFDRQRFDRYLFRLALKQGTHFYPQHRLVKIERNSQGKTNLIFKHKNCLRLFSFDIVVGADGPSSLVYQYLNPRRKKRFYYGLQAVVRGNFNPAIYQTFFGSQVCPYFFAWLVPESATQARIGLATLKAPLFHFNALFQKLNVKPNQIILRQGGLIPLFDSKIRFHQKNIFLLGDAASHLKATTGGGLVSAFQQARELVSSLAKKQPYQPNLKSLKLHLFLRKALNKFSDQDYNKLIYLLSKPKNKKLLEEHSRENPRQLLWQLIFHEPRLLYFARHLL